MSDEQTVATATQATENKEVPKISIAGVLADLKEGLTRKDIGIKYGLNGVQTKALFKNKKLIGKKTHVNAGTTFEIIEDAPDEVELTYPKGKSVMKVKDAPAGEGNGVNYEQAQTPMPDVAPQGTPQAEPAGW